MNKKTIAGVFAALFLLLSLLPAAGMLLSGQSVSAANETLSQPPKLLNPAGKINLLSGIGGEIRPVSSGL